MIGRLLAAALCLWISAAHADQTVRNFFGASIIGNENIVNLYDTNGSKIDANWGNIVQFGVDQPIYWHGTASICGWSPGNTNLNWCGLKTYKCANATGGTDLLNCVDQGYLFDPAPWLTTCAPRASFFSGCWQAPMLYNAANNNYVLYMEQQWAVGSPPSNLFYFTCTTPIGPCTYGGVVTLSHDIASGTPFVDNNGDAYYAYDAQDGSFTAYIDKLNSSYTAWDGVNTNSSLGLTNKEGFAIARHGTNYLVFWGNLCGDCATGGGLFVTTTCANILTCTATANTTTLNSDACASQLMTVAKIVAGGQTTWLYQGIRFNQNVSNNNHGQSANYFQPLTFSGDQAQAFSCNATVTIPGITGSTYPTPAPSVLSHPVPDQTDFANAATFNDEFIFKVDNTHQWLQTFVPQNSNLYAVGFGIGYNSVCTPSAACASIDPGTATLDVVTVDGSNNITSTLASVNYNSANAGWASAWKVAVVNLTGLTVGGHYGLRLRAASAGTNMYWASPQVVQLGAVTPTPYSAGVFRQSTDTGSSFTSAAAGSLMFETYPAAGAAIVPFSGVAH